MSSEQEPKTWLALPELAESSPRGLLEMRKAWLTVYGPLRCARCGAAIRAGQWFRLAGYCAMGGVIPAPALGAFADMLEPHAEHADCAATPDEEPPHP